jgi:hypothetical protein
MRTRRPAGGPAFPFPPTPESEERGLAVVEEAEAPPTREISIRRNYDVRPGYEVHSAETGDPADGPFVYYSQTSGPNIHDQRLFQMEKKDGRWKMAFAWQAEGNGEVPFFMKLMTRMPDAFNRGTNMMLYDMDHIWGSALVFMDKFLGQGFMQKAFGLDHEDEE